MSFSHRNEAIYVVEDVCVEPPVHAKEFQWLFTLSKSQLPPAARRTLLSLILRGQVRVYRSLVTGDWMVWQAIQGRDNTTHPGVRKSLHHWVKEFLCAQEGL